MDELLEWESPFSSYVSQIVGMLQAFHKIIAADEARNRSVVMARLKARLKVIEDDDEPPASA
ncbi:hypothetical protein [Rhodoblastus sp.]|uniref:hypothetical protein n=1 Tax=Rhodoblastus sp. TaxID=1962975 RepID=UPI003F99EAAC